MTQINSNVNGIFIPFSCLSVLMQLDEEDMWSALNSYLQYRCGEEDYDAAYHGLGSNASRCGFCLLCEYATAGELGREINE